MTELTIDQVRAAARRLAGVAHKTPLLTSRTLDEYCGATVLLKAELFQRGGSFKIRGAYNRISLLDAGQRASGVVAYSSGNHGGAVALAARMLGTKALVVVPDNVSPAKLAAIEGYGAQTYRYQYGRENREEVAAAIAAKRSMTLIPPFDDYQVMAGQGTVGLELAEQARTIDVVLVPVGGGGLAAGVATAVKALLPRAAVIGVEPSAADDTWQSLHAGRLVTIAPPATIADGLRAEHPGSLTYPVNSRLLDDIVTVSDDQIIAALRFCFARLKLVVEPSGAVPLAALLGGAVKVAGQRVAAVVSGGNIAPADFAAYLTKPSTDFEGGRS
jgi:threo-3-hydroxy-L-aspartate ammonia-lyase